MSLSHLLPTYFMWLLQDSFRLFLVVLTVFVLYLSFFFVAHPTTIDPIFFIMFVPCYLVFSSGSLLVVYVSYELSLLPIIYIIVKWGSYPDRSLRALMLFIYTRVFSLPLIVGLFYIYSCSFTFIYLLVPSVILSTPVLRLLIFLAFGVKLPVYGLHYWLPIAHVEAPTFGSMILAGILLKLGGIGLIRFFLFLDLSFLRTYVLSYLLVFLVLSTLVCCCQSDFKRIVAYSSVSHMISIPLVALAGFFGSLKVSVLLIVFHGLRSPVLFSLVGILYSVYSTRQLVLIRGLILTSPLLSFICLISFLFSLSAPPYPSFFSEVFFFVFVYFLSSSSLMFLLMFALISLVYNLSWLSIILFSKSYSSVCSLDSSSSSFFLLLPLLYSHLFSFIMLFLIPLI